MNAQVTSVRTEPRVITWRMSTHVLVWQDGPDQFVKTVTFNDR